MSKKIFFLFIISCVVYCANENLIDKLQLLSTTLNTLDASLENRSTNFLLGPYLLKKYLADLFSKQILTSLNLDGKLPVLISFDQKNKLYQLRCLNIPDRSGCSAFRNYFYLNEGVHSASDQYASLYAIMLDKQSFNQFANTIGCTGKGVIREKEFLELIANIKKSNCTNFLQCLPVSAQGAEKWCVLFNAYTKSDEQISIEETEGLGKTIERDLPQFEQIAVDSHIMSTLKILLLNSFEMLTRLLKNIRKLNQRPDYTFGIIVGISLDKSHQLCLLINKHAGQLEYVLADSRNESVASSAWKQQYFNALNMIVDFIENPSKLEEYIIRTFYFVTFRRVSKNLENREYTKIIATLVSVAFALQSSELSKNDLYITIYKPKFLALVNVVQKEDTANKEVYERIRNRF